MLTTMAGLEGGVLDEQWYREGEGLAGVPASPGSAFTRVDTRSPNRVGHVQPGVPLPASGRPSGTGECAATLCRKAVPLVFAGLRRVFQGIQVPSRTLHSPRFRALVARKTGCMSYPSGVVPSGRSGALTTTGWSMIELSVTDPTTAVRAVAYRAALYSTVTNQPEEKS